MSAEAPSHIPIFLYHSISDPGPPGKERFAVAPRIFREHLEIMADAGRTPLTISRLADGLSGRAELPEDPVAVTFDDGFADGFGAIEAVLEHGLRATMYIPSRRIGEEGMLDRERIRALDEMGDAVEIGAHSASHPRLDEIPLDRATAEIRESKQTLEAALEREVRTFAYPYGAYDARVRDAVVNAGFDSAVAVKDELSHVDDDRFALARVTISAVTPSDRVRDVLRGVGVPRARRRARIRTRAYRQVRRIRHRLG